MNKTMLSGRLTKDADLNYTAGSGIAVTRFTLAVKRPFKKNETDFINCIAFGKTAETIANYTQKGQEIIVEGSIKTGSYEKDGKKVYTTDIIVNQFEFIGASKGNAESQKPEQNKGFLEEVTPEDVGDLPF